MRMNSTMAATLMKENQNSVSAKKRTESAFEVKITTMNRALQIHTGSAGEPFAQISPAAVNSDPNATVQVSQYRIATVKPVPGPMNLVAYTWNEPVSGMATESSPRLSMTRYTITAPIA